MACNTAHTPCFTINTQQEGNSYALPNPPESMGPMTGIPSKYGMHTASVGIFNLITSGMLEHCWQVVAMNEFMHYNNIIL